MEGSFFSRDKKSERRARSEQRSYFEIVMETKPKTDHNVELASFLFSAALFDFVLLNIRVLAFFYPENG